MDQREVEESETSGAGNVGVGAEPLQPTDTAVTVRKRADGKVLMIDGPFAETKEQLAGYYILDCANVEEAIEWASKIPTGCQGRGLCRDSTAENDESSGWLICFNRSRFESDRDEENVMKYLLMIYPVGVIGCGPPTNTISMSGTFQFTAIR